MPSTTLLRRYLQAREAYERSDTETKELKAKRDALQLELHEAMEAEGDKSVTRDLGPPYGEVRFVPNETIFGDVYDDDGFLDWVNSNAATEELTKPAFRKRQVNELVRRLLASGQNLPPGLEHRKTRYVTVTRKR